MPLKYPPEWKYDNFGVVVPEDVHKDFYHLLRMISDDSPSKEKRKEIYEKYKHAFGNMGESSSLDWAEGDFMTAMDAAAKNGGTYVAGLWQAIESAKEMGLITPSQKRINEMLEKGGIPFVIAPPDLLLKDGDIVLSHEEASVDHRVSAFVRGREIGRGGFGVVYLVTRKTTIGEFRFAMKVLEPHIYNPKPERAIPRFEREMQALGKLQHRAIVPLLEAGVGPGGKPYILMPFIDGQNIRTALSGASPIQVGRIFDEILNAIVFAHEQGVLHRDLSPDNVLVRTADDQPIILDFGCSYLLDGADLALTTSVIGKSPYLPPEVLHDPSHKDVRQDVYACGVMLYEVIAQRLPRPDNYKPLEPDFKEWKGIDEVIQQSLAPEHERFPNAATFRSALRKLNLYY